MITADITLRQLSYCIPLGKMSIKKKFQTVGCYGDW